MFMHRKLFRLAAAAGVLAASPLPGDAEDRSLRELLDNREIEAAREAVRTMPDVDLRDEQGDTPLCIALGAAHLDKYALFLGLLDRGADPDLACANGMRPLTMAVGFGTYPAVQLLLDRGAAFDYTDGRSMMPPLAMAYFNGRAAVAELLESCGARIEEHVRVEGVRAHAYQRAYLAEMEKMPAGLEGGARIEAMLRAALAAQRATLVHETNSYQYAFEDLWLRKAAEARYEEKRPGEGPAEWEQRVRFEAALDAASELEASGRWSQDQLPPLIVDVEALDQTGAR